MLAASPARLTRRIVPALLVVFYGCSDPSAPTAPRIESRAHALAAPMVTVLNTDDAGAGSLRQAILDAAAGSVIQFDAAIAGQAIVLSTGQIVIDKLLTIEGPIPLGMTISGGMSSRVFNVFPDGNVVFRNVSIVNGNEQTVGGGGGGLWVNGTVLLDHVLVANNQTGNTGGAIFVKSSGQLTLINTTVSGNSGGLGGGIASGGSVTIWNSTIVNNTSTQAGGVWVPEGSLYLRNSIIANNTDSEGATAYDNCQVGPNTAVRYAGANLSNDDSCGSAPNVMVADPNLGPLGDHGGPTKTHALNIMSPGIDLGNACTEATDQRYVTRNQGASCDVGAFEFNDFGTVSLAIGPNASVNAKTGIITLTGTISCSKPGVSRLGVTVSQTQKTTGKFSTIIQGYGETSLLSCDTRTASWSAIVNPTSSGKLDKGTASVAVSTISLPPGFLAANASATVKVFVAK